MSARCCVVAIVLVLHGSAVLAQGANLIETPRAGDCSRYSVEMKLAGHLTVAQESGKEQLRLEAQARQRFAERTLNVADGMASRSVRHYDEAVAITTVAGEKLERTLSRDRRQIVARTGTDGPFCYSPAGSLTRDELDLVEHFDPHCLAGLLPGKAMNVGDTWLVGNAAAHAASLLDSLTRNGLTGRLVGVADGTASFAIEGSLEGIENGARVSMTVNAAGKYDIAQKRVVELTWKQADVRDAGPVTPESKVEAVIELKREALDSPPKELADDSVHALTTTEPSAAAVLLRYADPRDRYRFSYPRQWHITGESDPHLVLRLLDREAFTVQVTITVWKKAEPGKHATVEEFKKAVAEAPGWTADRVLEDGEVALGGGRWLYRLGIAGKIREVPVIQRFHLLAGPGGDQLVVTVTLPPEQVKAVGTRDLELIRAIEIGGASPK